MREDWQKAALTGNVELIGSLLAEGLAVDSRDRYGQTALMLASLHGHVELVRFLIAKGAALDVTAKYSLSALMLAVINRRYEIVRLLLEAGADTELQGSGAPGFAGKTARDLAEQYGLDALVAEISRGR